MKLYRASKILKKVRLNYKIIRKARSDAPAVRAAQIRLRLKVLKSIYKSEYLSSMILRAASIACLLSSISVGPLLGDTSLHMSLLRPNRAP